MTQKEIDEYLKLTAHNHIIIYQHLLKLYKQQDIFHLKVYNDIENNCSILKSLNTLGENEEIILLQSTYNIKLMFKMLEKISTPLTLTLLGIIKKNMIKRLKHLQMLKEQYSTKDNDSQNITAESLDENIKHDKENNNNDESASISSTTGKGEVDSSTSKRKKKRSKSWSRGVIKKKMNKQKHSAKNDGLEDSPNSDKIDKSRYKTRLSKKTGDNHIDYKDKLCRSIFTEDLNNFNEPREKRNCTVAMNQMLPNLNRLHSFTSKSVSGLCKKLNITTSFYEFDLHEIGTFPIDKIAIPNSKEKEMAFYEKSKVTARMLSEHPFVTVGPFEVLRPYDDLYVFKCHVEDCQNWVATQLHLLHRHIQQFHFETVYNWNCSLCTVVDQTMYEKLNDFPDLMCAFNHLANFHIIKKKGANYLMEKYQQKNGSYVPKVSDESSAKDGLKIVSVSTLNPNYSRCGAYKFNLNKFNQVPKLFQCPIPNCNFTSDSELDSLRHFLKEFDGTESFECTYCKRLFSDAFSYCYHILKEHGLDKYQCPYCCYRSLSKHNVKHHITDHHHSNSVWVIVGRERNNMLYDSQDECKIDFKAFLCPKINCDFKSNIFETIQEHINSQHPQVVSLQCRICSLKLNSVLFLKGHMIEHCFGEYQCKYCPVGYSNVQGMRRHMYQMHASREPLVILRKDYDKNIECPTIQFEKFTKFETQLENLILINLDLDRVEQFWDTNVISVEEFDKELLKQNETNLWENEEIPDVSATTEPDQNEDLIVLSDSEDVANKNGKNKRSKKPKTNIEKEIKEQPPTEHILGEHFTGLKYSEDATSKNLQNKLYRKPKTSMGKEIQEQQTEPKLSGHFFGLMCSEDLSSNNMMNKVNEKPQTNIENRKQDQQLTKSRPNGNFIDGYSEGVAKNLNNVKVDPDFNIKQEEITATQQEAKLHGLSTTGVPLSSDLRKGNVSDPNIIVHSVNQSHLVMEVPPPVFKSRPKKKNSARKSTSNGFLKRPKIGEVVGK